MKKAGNATGSFRTAVRRGGKSEEKEGTGTYTNDNGEKTTARVKLKNDKIAEVEIDEIRKGQG